MNIHPIGFQSNPYSVNRSNNRNITFGSTASEIKEVFLKPGLIADYHVRYPKLNLEAPLRVKETPDEYSRHPIFTLQQGETTFYVKAEDLKGVE